MKQKTRWWPGRSMWKMAVISGLAALLIAGCGDPEPTENDANQQQNQSQNQNDEAHNYGERPDDLQSRCEAACDRIYAEERCDTFFSRDEDDGGGAMSESGCVDTCVDEELFRGGEWCVATEADCGDDPHQMVEGCLPDDYHPAACDHLGVWDLQDTSLEEQAVDLLNERRSQGVDCDGQQFEPVGEVTMDEHLRCAARLHSVDMAEYGYFSTTNPDTGVSARDRAEDGEYAGDVLYSRVNSGDQTAEQLVDLNWFDEPEDCEEVMDPEFVDIGIGRYTENRWTTIFGDGG